MYRSISWGALLFFLAASASVLAGVDSSLQVRVLGENGDTLHGFAEVRLTCSGFIVGTSPINGLGEVEFSSLRPSRCSATVTGPGLMPADSETIQLASGQHASITVTVRSAARSNPGLAASISVAQLKVPPKVEKELHKAVKLAQRGDDENAVSLCRKALADYPGYADAYNLLGVVAARQGHTEEAEADFLHAVQADPGHAGAHTNLARIAQNRKDWPTAEKFAARGAALDPSNPEPLVLLAIAQFAQGRFADAAASAERADSLAPLRFPIVHLLSARAFVQLRRFTDATREYRQFLREEVPASSNAALARKELADLGG